MLSEDFDYPASELLKAHGWTAFSGVDTNSITITSPGLSYPGYANSGIGNAVFLTTSGEDVYRKFDSGDTLNSGSIYVSALIKVISAGPWVNNFPTWDYFLHLGNGSTDYGALLFVSSNESGFRFGISNKPNTVVGGRLCNFNTTYLVVIKYSFIAGNSNDVASLFVNPSLLGSEPSPDASYSGWPSVDLSYVDRIYLRQGSADNAPTLIIDGIRVSNSWGDAPLPVELSSFGSNVRGQNIILNWSTQTEKNSEKFNLERKTIATNWVDIGAVKAAVLSNSPKQYSFTDKNLQSGKYQYRIKMFDNDGTFEYSKVIEAEVAIPNNFELSQNYPNPFNPQTKISYNIPFDSKVTLEVYNITGERITLLVNEEQSAGFYSVDFGSSVRLTSGVYIYRIVAIDKITGNNFSSVKKMMLLK
ncbi:MAG: T9SS type A sorting domain-containing protein [Ignavibacteriaceae bacterium]|nr:T9SS type A sorting domain-containing protein [Ignavibacteriaceae bacterium]